MEYNVNANKRKPLITVLVIFSVGLAIALVPTVYRGLPDYVFHLPALVIFTADCTPILLHDPVTGAVGAAHAGWRGTASGIVKNAVDASFRILSIPNSSASNR